MRQKILYKASEMFLDLGFKSVTMDCISKEMGISKKTIYEYFDTKSNLVKCVIDSLFAEICMGIDGICQLNKNPIEEIYDIRNLVSKYHRENSPSWYQLQKYYTEIHDSLKKKQFEVVHGCIKKNVNNGVKSGLYRSEIDKEFISRMYFLGITGVKDARLFPLDKFSTKVAMSSFLEYHLRAIVTAKGLVVLNEYID